MTMTKQESEYYMDLENTYGAHNYHPIPVVISRAEACSHLFHREGSFRDPSLQEIPRQAGLWEDQEIMLCTQVPDPIPDPLEIPPHVGLPGLELDQTHPEGGRGVFTLNRHWIVPAPGESFRACRSPCDPGKQRDPRPPLPGGTPVRGGAPLRQHPFNVRGPWELRMGFRRPPRATAGTLSCPGTHRPPPAYLRDPDSGVETPRRRTGPRIDRVGTG